MAQDFRVVTYKSAPHAPRISRTSMPRNKKSRKDLFAMSKTDMTYCDKVALAILKGTANRYMVASFVRVYTEYRKMLLGPLLPEAVYRVIRQRERLSKDIRTRFMKPIHDPKFNELTQAVMANGFQLSVVNIKRPVSDHGYEQLDVTYSAPWIAFEPAEPVWEDALFEPSDEPAVEIIGP